MSPLSYILLGYVLVTLSALVAIHSMDAQDRSRHYRALEKAEVKFIEINAMYSDEGMRDKQLRDATQGMIFTPFPIRSYAENDFARRWLKKTIEILNAPRKERRSLNRQRQ